MTFDEILEQVIALLKRQGRVSYRALKMRYEEIDDEYLEVLKEELIDAQRLATDEDGRIMVWAGGTGEVPEPISQPNQPEPQPVVEQPQPASVESPPAETRILDAERRQLTVMFVDLVGSTRLSSELDPEDLREIVRDYQRSCTEVITKYAGNIAQLLGDGLLVYFGYPQAHEDDAQRAVRSGLGIIEAIGALNTRLEQNKGVNLAVRLGIHTGLVVVGEMGGEGRQEQLALGATPNVAARIQGLAEPDTVVISDATYRLIQGYFAFEMLGEHELRGVAQPIAVYRVLRESGVQSRLDVASARGLTPLVGRESERTLLFERWAQVKNGSGRVILLSGEAGIGKSRLVQVLKDHVAEGTHTRLECRSSPYFTNSAMYPITDFLQWTLQFQTDDTPETKLEKLEESLSHYRLPLKESVPLFAFLLSLPLPKDHYPQLNLTPQRQRQKTLEAIVAIVLELSERQPVLFILEDAHWQDPSTNELLGLLVDQTPTAQLLLLITCRPEFQPSWSHRSYLTEMTINRLSHNQVERMAQQVANGKRLPVEVIQQLVDKTDGVPLYVEEMTKAVLESGILQETNGHYELVGSIASLSIPATLQDSLMGRLDQLVTAKGVAQYASVIGRQFSYALLREVSQLDEAMLQHELGRLVDAELVYQRGLPPQATYIFKHALIQDTAYESLLRSTRQAYHRRIAEVLKEQFPDTSQTQPELLAHHYTAGGLNEQAIEYWQQAGELAVARSANQEAIHHLTQGLELLTTLPVSSTRTQQELVMLTKLGPALMATKGYADTEVEETYARARELCQRVEQTPQLFPVLWGLWLFSTARARHRTAQELGAQLLALAQHVQDAELLLEAHHALWTTLLHLGQVVIAYEHTKQGLMLYNPTHHHAHTFLYGGHDPGVCSYNFASRALWLLGYPEQALQQSHAALSLAQQLAHPFSLALAQYVSAMLHQLRREAQAVREQAEAALAIGTAHGLPYVVALSTLLRGWALAEQSTSDTGLPQMQQGFAALQATGNETFLPWCLAALAEVYGKAFHVEKGLTALDEAMRWVEKNEERSIEAELHRLKGELLLQQSSDNATEVEFCFHKALDIAQSQQAKSWELRAAASLARLWQSQGKRKESRDLLEPVYLWFTEGFDTVDLKDAKALLDELS